MSDPSSTHEETPIPARLVETDESPSDAAAPPAPEAPTHDGVGGVPLDLFDSPEQRQRSNRPRRRPANPAETHRRMVGAEHAEPRRRRIATPVVLFVLTCLSTFWAGCAPAHCEDVLYYVLSGAGNAINGMVGLPTGGTDYGSRIRDAIVANWQNGLIYMACVLAILFVHEMGHFVMTLRYRIAASLPYFLPVPFTPIGTMGAVISMDGLSANRRQIFDIGIAGPLAGLVVAIPITWYGVVTLDLTTDPNISRAEQTRQRTEGFTYHMPWMVTAMADAAQPEGVAEFGQVESLPTHRMNPFLMAGWVGLLITGLNMMPISQLDGGHVIYALFGKRAHAIARMCLFMAILLVVVYFDRVFFWTLMLVLVTLMGTDHPPTADDRVPLGRFRTLLGLASLTIPFLCFPFLGFLPQAF